MKINEHIEMLEVTIQVGANQMVINPTVIRDEHAYVLVDTGMPGSYGLIKKLLTQAGIDPKAPYSIILTHQDIDHVGGLPEFKGESVDVYAHTDDQPYIDGLKPMIKLNEEFKERLIASLPRDLASAFETNFSGKVKNVTRLLADREKLPFGGGLTVIHTPGHTPGHICLYHELSKTLIAGDAMVIEKGKLHGPNSAVTPDMKTALASLRKFKDYSIDNVICYHGGVFQGDVRAAIDELTESL
ncbi:MBL fold metallo-hydrolase [Paenibacillus radicis (ex Xue et al. 2023)]|uniref:MBL fold metallo-hydrolase n=1 Tax=Paenibacillus radicis (ex Xue et al. 2023) TaxID=2972489 RepID=A0ABT1YFZ4_9BACL|nr:MBL fold metallo-hydrolase [Paenibacillus radicis (ex Xue et al. 2023)]MCR8632116.1 MBL fold metallo-hydrolase [Paenibacillus radicis (ex Xue et al. 2023)]